jgi:hypothetical protein
MLLDVDLKIVFVSFLFRKGYLFLSFNTSTSMYTVVCRYYCCLPPLPHPHHRHPLQIFKP